MRFSLLRTRKLSRGVVACADFLTDKNAFLRGQDKMDTHEKVVVVCSRTAVAKSVGEKLVLFKELLAW